MPPRPPRTGSRGTRPGSAPGWQARSAWSGARCVGPGGVADLQADHRGISQAYPTAGCRGRSSRFLDPGSWWPATLLRAVSLDRLEGLPLGVGWAEVGAVAGEDLDPLSAGILDGLGDEVCGVVVPPSRHRDVRRGGTRGVPDGNMGSIDGLALGPVDGCGVGELDKRGRVLR